MTEGIQNTARIAKDFGVSFIELSSNQLNALAKFLNNNERFNNEQRQELESVFFSENYEEFASKINATENPRVGSSILSLGTRDFM